MDYPHDIIKYLNKKGVMVIFLFRRNTLRRLVSVLANDYDRTAKQLNGTHKAHVHSQEEVSISLTHITCQIKFPRQLAHHFLLDFSATCSWLFAG